MSKIVALRQGSAVAAFARKDEAKKAVATHASAAAVKLRKAGMVASGANVFVQECAPPGTGGWTDSNWWTPFIAATASFVKTKDAGC